jgi:putative tryptophan/tyrosine transport system substrate-binding protein
MLDGAGEVVRIKRRMFIALLGSGVMTWPSIPHAQQPTAKPFRIGVLETVAASQNSANWNAFRKGLQERGYEEGKNLVIEYRSADGVAERFPHFAAELVSLGVDLIVTRGTPAAQAAKTATAFIPVVMVAIGEPVRAGVIASLPRPGGNVTGFSTFSTELAGKRVELVKELLPGSSRVALLNNMSNPVTPPQWEETKRAARAFGLEADFVDVRSEADIAPAFETARSRHVDAIIVGIDAVTQANHQLIVDLAARNQLPTVYGSREFVDAGGLMTYGVSFPQLYFRAAILVDKILKGAKPENLPVQEPTTFELIINLKTAKALGITVPPPLMVRAEELIE